MTKTKLAEYVWIDGTLPTQQLRSKTKVVHFTNAPTIEDFDDWSFDGSSTNQATGDDSDCILKPVRFIDDPIRGEGNYLLLCEVFNPDGSPHASNSRIQLRKVLSAGAEKQDPWIGFEQEYTLFNHRNPLGWPENGFPAPQGPYYCGVGSGTVFGRKLADLHAKLCLQAGILFYGINAEVMPGQWEFQIGYRGIKGEPGDVLLVSDHTWLARWLLIRLGEEYSVRVCFDNKPIKGDWNGAGLHTNFSTNLMRERETGRKAIENAMKSLEEKHADHIPFYGDKLAERLTGLHETSAMESFSYGVAHRGCSVRIPQPVHLKGYGYFEDRRPGANADPYLIAARLCATVCDVEDSVIDFTWGAIDSTKKAA